MGLCKKTFFTWFYQTYFKFFILWAGEEKYFLCSPLLPHRERSSKMRGQTTRTFDSSDYMIDCDENSMPISHHPINPNTDRLWHSIQNTPLCGFAALRDLNNLVSPFNWCAWFFFAQSRKEKRPCAKHPARPFPHLEHDFEDETIYRMQYHPVHPINPQNRVQKKKQSHLIPGKIPPFVPWLFAHNKRYEKHISLINCFLYF